MIMPELETRRDIFDELAEVLTHSLTDRLKSFEASSTFYGMDTDALGGTVIDGSEYRHLTIGQCDGCGRVSTPHLVWLLSDDRAIMRIAVDDVWPACRSQYPGHPH